MSLCTFSLAHCACRLGFRQLGPEVRSHDTGITASRSTFTNTMIHRHRHPSSSAMTIIIIIIIIISCRLEILGHLHRSHHQHHDPSSSSSIIIINNNYKNHHLRARRCRERVSSAQGLQIPSDREFRLPRLRFFTPRPQQSPLIHSPAPIQHPPPIQHLPPM